MELNIKELRKRGRPLWMSEFSHASYAEMLGAGGDIYLDRLHREWERDGGFEVEEKD